MCSQIQPENLINEIKIIYEEMVDDMDCIGNISNQVLQKYSNILSWFNHYNIQPPFINIQQNNGYWMLLQ